ncbi:MAG: redoxin domain-containing protein [Leptospiraceae bacterium]|nr:redoxin domain-containing protein [Leptospiraceae bacterium]
MKLDKSVFIKACLRSSYSILKSQVPRASNTLFRQALILLFLTFPIFAETVANFALFDINGNRILFYKILSELNSDEKIILNFTSVHCKPCEIEITELISLKEKRKNMKLFVIFAEQGEDVREKMKKLNLDEVFIDPIGTLQGKFGVKGYPVTIIINKNAQKLISIEGYSSENIKTITKYLAPQKN